MERYCERARRGNIIGMQRTVAANRAVLDGTHLQLVQEEAGCRSAVHLPAAHSPDAMNCEIAHKLHVGCRAQGVAVSGHGV